VAEATPHTLQTAQDWVAKHLPKFIYFDNYDVIDSAIHVPTFVSQLASTPNAPRVRTTNCLFQHVGLDVSQLAELGRHQLGQEESEAVRRQVDQRAILASSASNAMTKKFADWWKQRRHTFRYQFDGDYFRIWVSDDLDPSEIELDQRSVGMQYFFSFFTVFLVEAAGAHTGSILLLDEPGMHLHGTAQAAIVQFLDHLSEDNQTLYTTHSPFMVDVDHLERARAVYEGEDGTTQVSEDVWPRDRESLFPLQAALGYQLAQGLFVSKRQVIVEGLTDLWLLKALDQALAARRRQRLRPDIILVPSAGVAKLLPLAVRNAHHSG
jgi:predicted ATP-dependent endonuclease of OLD family